ncbi:MAG: OB-fold nucleic acid binding domain-containing protein, partial [Solirubrobacteraceae bacterium]
GSTGASRKGMLEVLSQAQSAGQKSQQDALIGQGSIFDLDPPSGQAGSGQSGQAPAGSSLLRISHPPIPAEEFDQAELLAVEKEAIGLFISAHPLKPLREALRAKCDCALAALAERRDKDWVTIGGIITETKKIRTRNGDHMMFATLDDLEGSVEMLVFGKALSEYEAFLAVDQIVLIRGRVDHKEAGKTCVVVQEAQSFKPTEQEVEQARTQATVQAAHAQPVHLQMDATRLPASVIDELKEIINENPGSAEVVLEMATVAGARRLRLGEAYRVKHTPTLRAELEQILAQAMSMSPASLAS